MPLILFCGYPCSGKSLVAAKLAEVEVVSEEKQLRSQIKSQACEHLPHLVIQLDANNYIKGYRYELHCVAKSTRHQQAIVYCTTPEMTCRANNSQVCCVCLGIIFTGFVSCNNDGLEILIPVTDFYFQNQIYLSKETEF
ncbi:unnamed protein product [Mesocestoides corti]|uniref:Protein KTI12 homolog n=1 Tax=Mesocestoides corti TaxID=53468 RepID=A0A0R3UF52_MESCO|nr:unnamed protein product [Mesocestoides corti]